MKIESLSDRQLFDLCRQYGTSAKMWSRKFAALLPEVEKRQLHRKHGCYSIFEFAAKFGGLNKKAVEEVLRTYKKVENKPLLKAEIEKAGWGKVRAVTSLVEEESEEKLVHMIQTLPKKALETCVREIKKQKFPPGWEFQPAKTVKLSFTVDTDTEFRLRKFQQKLEKERKETVSFNEVLKELLDKVEEKPKKPRQTKKPVKTTRYIPASKKHELHQKYQGQCAYPDCNRPAEVYHHPDRFALTKSHNNVTPLCKEHHQIAHAGLIENEQKDREAWRIRKNAMQNYIDKKIQYFR